MLQSRLQARFKSSSPVSHQVEVSPCSLAFELQFAFVRFKKLVKTIRCGKQPHPLLIVECHGKAAQSVHADAPLLAHFEFQLSALFGSGFFLELSNAS